MKATRIALTLVAFILAAAFAAFVWPTLYRPIGILPMSFATPEIVAARQNRITGDVQWLPALSYRWVSGGDYAAAPPKPER